VATNKTYIRIWDSILSNPDVKTMGLEAFGAWVLLAIHAQKNGYRGQFKFKDKAELISIIGCKSARKLTSILNSLQHSKDSKNCMLNWIQIDFQKRTCFISNWRKYQEILRHKKGTDWAQIMPQNRQDLGTNHPLDSYRELLDSTSSSDLLHKSSEEVSVENSTKPKSESRKLTDFIKEHCPTLVKRFPQVYQWALKMRKLKSRDSRIMATAIYTNRHLNDFPEATQTLADTLTDFGLWGYMTKCLDQAWGGMLKIEKEINRDTGKGLMAALQKMQDERR
jgi:hypothetical protein